MKSIHLTFSPQAIKCTHCEYDFTSSEAMIVHIKSIHSSFAYEEHTGITCRGKTANNSVFRTTHFLLKVMERRIEIYIHCHFDSKRNIVKTSIRYNFCVPWDIYEPNSEAFFSSKIYVAHSLWRTTKIVPQMACL